MRKKIKDKIHIMHVIYALDTGGMQKGLINLVNRLNPNIFVNSICCLTKADSSREKVKGEVEIFELEKKEGQDFFLPIRLAILFRKKKVDIVHARCWGALFDGVIGAKIANIPIIIYGEHGRRYEDIVQSKKRHIWIRKIILSFFVDNIVSVSNETKEWLVNSIKINQDKIICIHNGIDLLEGAFEVNIINKKQQLGIQKEDRVIGTVGRLDRVKDYPTLLYATSEVVKYFPKIKILFIGDGPHRNELENLSTSLGIKENIIFLGERKDVIELLKIMDIFIMTSLIEGISNTILEAMSCGLPIITTNVGGNSEVVLDGATGFLVPPKRPDLVAEAIMKILNDIPKAHILGAFGRQRITQYFTLSKMIDKYEELYKSRAKKLSLIEV